MPEYPIKNVFKVLFKTADRNIFLSIIENDDGVLLRPETLFAYNSNLLFPDINVDEIYPEIELFVETLESFYTDTRVFLSLPAPYSIKANLLDTSDELVLGVSKINHVGEMPWYLVTPLGTFNLEFLSLRGNAYVERCDTVLTDEMKKGLFLVPCEYEFSSNHSGGQILHVYDPNMPFPPLKPEEYIMGSRSERLAREYWRMQEIKDECYKKATSVYCSDDDDPYVELVDAKDGSITRIYGDPDEIIAEAQEAVKRGEAAGFRFYDPGEEDFYPDDEPDLFDEILGEECEDDDYDPDWDDTLLQEDDWQQVTHETQIDTIHYVIRPED